MDFSQFLLQLIVILTAARLVGYVARLLGQPAVLGELLAGVLIGPSVFGQIESMRWISIDPHDHTLHLLAELGVVLLLFEIGLETDLRKLLAVGPASVVVAIAGVVLPFGLGFGACVLLQQDYIVATIAGATLTATSVGITARVLSELGRLQDEESRIILGAAVFDDILGLVILAVVSAQLNGSDVGTFQILRIAGVAFGFLGGALVIGILLRPLFRRLFDRMDPSSTLSIAALVLGFFLAYLADWFQPRLNIVGAFAAGLVLSGLPQVRTIEEGITPIGHFLVPIFFVVTGANVDVTLLNPLEKANHAVLFLGSVLFVAAVIGKFASGYSLFWFKGNKNVIGVGMVPRGEVGLIFASAGRSALGAAMFSALTLVIMLTTFIVPPILKILLKPKPLTKVQELSGVEELVAEPD